jgi:hypothetical protein
MNQQAPQPRVLIATPVNDDNVTTLYALSVQNLVTHLYGRVEFISQFISSAMVHKARNAFASIVLEDSRYSHLLFIDADMGFRPEAVERMLAFDKPIVGAMTPQRTIDLARLHAVSREQPDPTVAVAKAQRYVAAKLLKTEAPGGGTAFAVDRGFVRTSETGTGLTLIKREALVRLREAFPDLVAPADPRYQGLGVRSEVFQVFEPSVQGPGGVFLSEDLSFCRRWVEGCGGEIWTCVDEVITHAGRMRFSGRYLDQIRG